jgi:hypothetical protein
MSCISATEETVGGVAEAIETRSKSVYEINF